MKREKGIALLYIIIIIIAIIFVIGGAFIFKGSKKNNNSIRDMEYVDVENAIYEGPYGKFEWDEVYFEYKGKKYNKNEIAYMHKEFSEKTELTTNFDFDEMVDKYGYAAEVGPDYENSMNERVVGFDFLNFSEKELHYKDCPVTGVILYKAATSEYSICGLKIGDDFKDVYRILGEPVRKDQYTWVYYKDGDENNKGDCLYIDFYSTDGKITEMYLGTYESAEEEMHKYFNNDKTMFDFK